MQAIPSAPAAMTKGPPAGAATTGPVLLATDGRDSTDAAISAAVLIAQRLGVTVQPVAVLRAVPSFRIGGELPQLPEDYERARRAEMRREVTRRLEPVLGTAGEWTLELRTGAPAMEIAEAARAHGAALVVIGRGEHGVVDRLIGEERALQVVRTSPAPVLAVDARAEGAPRRAVVGVDFSAASIHAARTALRLLDPAPGAILVLVHARPRIDFGPPSVASWTHAYEERVTRMFTRLCELLAGEVPEGVLLENRLCTGTAPECLRSAALEVEADLIAVGTRGAPWTERLFVGSVATAMLRHAGRSVLVVPPPAPAERIALELSVAGGVRVEESEEWAAALDGFTRRNLGRPVRLEVAGHGLDGFAVQGRSARFAGAAWDVHDARVTIMLSAQEAALPHLTHAITSVRSIHIAADDAQRDLSLVVTDHEGESALVFRD